MKNLIGGLVLSLIFISCGTKSPEPATSETTEPAPSNIVNLSDAQLQNAKLTIGKIESQELSGTMRVNGTIALPVQSNVSVSFPLGGYVRSISVQVSSNVRKGDVLAVLEDNAYIQLQQDYLSAVENLSLLSKDLERQRSLNAEKINAEKAYQQAQSSYNLEQINVRALSEKLQLIGINPETLTPSTISRSVTLRSPINGAVSKINANIGKYLAPTDILMELINNDNPQAVLSIFENQLNLVNVNQAVVLHYGASLEKSINTTVYSISKDLDMNRIAQAYCRLSGNNPGLLPGTFITADLVTEKALSLCLPNEAIVSHEGKPCIFIVKDKNNFELVPVITGLHNDKVTQVIPRMNDTYQQGAIVTGNAHIVLAQMIAVTGEE